MYRYGIIVIGYKNAYSIQRLLKQLNLAEYGNDQVLLIISVDYSGEGNIRQLAEEYTWEHGEKIVKAYSERMGLRKHILNCGDYLEEYNLDAVAVFEDDTFPSVNFYQYMKNATDMYIEDDNIEGISLYTHSKNLYAKQEFIPLQTNSDVFFLQYAQSWGQVWFGKRWKEFKKWYLENSDTVEYRDDVPRNVSQWNENSWLKYHIKYCIEKNKYFVYPYVARATCFSEKGEHTVVSSNYLQLPLYMDRECEYIFSDFSEEALVYDAFFENMNLYKYCGVKKEELEVDLYGMHIRTDKKYLLSKKKLEYPRLKSWGNYLKPHELNIIYDIEGEEIFLYELENQSGISLPPNAREADKFEEYFNLLDRWMLDLEQGNTEYMGQWFVEQGISNIAIYGYGKLGRHLAFLLKSLDVKIKYVIDKGQKQENCDYLLIRPEDQLPQVDCIVVTPVNEYESIKEILSKKFAGRIISAEQIGR